MLRVTLKSLWAHKLRLGLTGLAIVLGVGFIAGTFVYTDTINKAFDGIFEDAFRGVDIVISADSQLQFGDGVYLPESEIQRLSEVEDVDELVPFLQGLGVVILDKDGEPIGGGGHHRAPSVSRKLMWVPADSTFARAGTHRDLERW